MITTIAAGALALALASGVSAEAGSFDDVLARAKGDGRRVVVFVHASWCGPCHRLTRDVLDSPEGAALFRNVHFFPLDADASPEKRRLSGWGVGAFPTLLVLRPDGSEVNRVVGYSGDRHTYVERVAPLLKPELTLAQLQEHRAAAVDDNERARLDIEIAHNKLRTGAVAEGEALLEDLAAQSAPSSADALFALAQLRDKPAEPALTISLWRELAMRFPSSPKAPAAEYEYARALHLLHDRYPGGDELAFGFLRHTLASSPPALAPERLETLIDMSAQLKLHKDLAKSAIDAGVRDGWLRKDDADELRSRLR